MSSQIEVPAIYEAVKAASVAVVLYHPDIPGPKNRPFTIIGSGFCIHPQGIIVTCRHVLDEFTDPGNRPPHVIFYHPKIAGHPGLYINIVPIRSSISDIQNSLSGEFFDLAMLKAAPPSEGYRGGYPTLPIAAYESVYEMMEVATCGFPIGNYLLDEIGTLTSSFTRGIISSIIPAPSVPQDQLRGFQLDLKAINGSSGGPVFSITSGQVCGVLKGGIERNKLPVFARAEPIYPAFADSLIKRLLI